MRYPMMAVVDGRRLVLRDREHFLSLSGKVEKVLPEIEVQAEAEAAEDEIGDSEQADESDPSAESVDGDVTPRKRGRPRKQEG